MNSNWSIGQLGDAVEFVIDNRGKTPKKLNGDWSESGYRALSAKNVKTGQIVSPESIRFVDSELYKKWMKVEISKGDILVTSEAPFGQIYYWNTDEKIVLSQRLFGLKINKKFDSAFLYYYMTTNAFWRELEARATGTTVVGLRQPELMKCQIKYPSLDEQKKISKILLKVDETINSCKELNDSILEQIDAAYENWLIEYVPFKEEEFKDSIVGKIPNSFDVYKIKDLADCFGGYSYSSGELGASSIGMATIKNFDRNGGFKVDGYKGINPSGKTKEGQYADLFDCIVAHTDLTQNADVIGNAEILLSKGGYEKIIMSMDLVKVVPTVEGLSKFLLAAILNNKKFKQYALGYVNGTTVLHLAKKALPEYDIALPKDFSRLEKLSLFIEKLYKNMAENMAKIDEMIILRNGLLNKLMK